MRIELAEGAKHDLVLEILIVNLPRSHPMPGGWAATQEAWSGVAPAART